MTLRSRITGWTTPEQVTVGRLSEAFGPLTIIDDNSDGPHLTAAAAFDLLAGDLDPQRVHLLAQQIRNRKQRRLFFRQVGARIRTDHQPASASQEYLFDRRAS